MYIRSIDGNLLRFERTLETAENWIIKNGYEIKYISGNAIYVINTDFWFIK